MDPFTHIPPFALQTLPPLPLVVLLRNTDLHATNLEPLLRTQDLPLKRCRFHPYQLDTSGTSTSISLLRDTNLAC